MPLRPARATAPRAAWSVVADGVRVLAALSVLVGTYRAGAVAAALFLLVLGGTTVPRLVAVVAAAALARWGAVATGDAAHPRAAVVVVVAGLGAVGALLWELGEWFGNAVLDPRIQVGYIDTLGDLAAGLLGSVVAGVVAARTDLLRHARTDGSPPR